MVPLFLMFQIDENIIKGDIKMVQMQYKEKCHYKMPFNQGVDYGGVSAILNRFGTHPLYHHVIC